MAFIRDIIEKGNNFLEPYISKVVDFITNFLGNGEYLVIGAILFFVTLVLLVGLIRWLRKAPKLFFFILILVGIVVTLGLLSK